MKKLDAATMPHGGTDLRDVRIRPYGVTDADRLRRMSDRVSKQSLFTRFWSGSPYIPEYYVRAMDALDHWDREAMVALLDDDMIGIAEYVRDATRPHRADLAALVADPWQRRGLGLTLVSCLAPLAERRGITEFNADVILENQRAMRSILVGWPDVGSALVDGAARFSLPLPMPVPVPG
ncbi:GNAT family N-acetyltransferase [Actinomadura sp. SCN-SB]|uniref:GNAT family N-acetyltransferase n=1 Tax=Actinomadura sp. SCN-SB TaxID=3373092 RepID=UPI0037502D44